MDDPPFPFNVGIECSSKALLELRPPHVGWLLASIEKGLKDLVCLSFIHGMNTNTLIVFN